MAQVWASVLQRGGLNQDQGGKIQKHARKVTVIMVCKVVKEEVKI